MSATARCRSETSLARGQRQRALSDGFCCEEQCFANVLSFEVRIQSQDLVDGFSLSDQRNDSCDRDAEPAKARNASHLTRVSRYAVELHALIVTSARLVGVVHVGAPA